MFKELRQRPQLVIAFLILFYTVGLFMFFFNATRPWFSTLTPFSLVLSFALVLVYQPYWTRRYVLVYILVFLSTFATEIIGVKTGMLFGHYIYGSALGFKIFDTPILIGINWLLLIYCTEAIAQYFFSSKPVIIIAGALMMVGYDAVLEYVAPVTDMWSWDRPYPGLRNFLMWFLISLAFHAVFQWFDLKIENKPARYLFLFQFLFFCIIALFAITTF